MSTSATPAGPTPPTIPAGAVAVTVFVQIGGGYVQCPAYFVMPAAQLVFTLDSNATVDSPEVIS